MSFNVFQPLSCYLDVFVYVSLSLLHAQHGAGVRGRMAGGAVASLHTSQVGRLHGMWRRVDEVYIKPFFGGRKRGAYRVQVSLSLSLSLSLVERTVFRSE